MWIRCRRLARRVARWVGRAVAISSHGLASAGIVVALAALVLPWLHDPASSEIAYRAGLNPRGAWIVAGLGLIGVAGLIATWLGAFSAALAWATRARARTGFAVAAMVLAAAPVPWSAVSSVGRSLANGRRPPLYRIEAILPASTPRTPLLGAGTIVWPVRVHARVTSGYGWRHHPIIGRTRFHNGIDIAVAEGTPVLAATDGRVDRAGEDPLNGRYVVLVRPGGLRTAYCHLSEVAVAVGGLVEAGEVIGASGQTGRATGPHLHFGAWVRGRSVDPRRLLAAR